MVPFVFEPQDRRNSAVDRGYDITNCFYVRIAGLYPDLEKGWKYWFWGAYLNFVFVAYAYYVSAYVIANLISFNYMDVELIGETLCFGSYTYVYFSVTCVFQIKRKTIDRLLEMVGNGIFQYDRPLTSAEKDIISKEVFKTRNFGKYTFCLPFTVAITQMGIVPAIHGFRGEYTSIVNGSAPINKHTPLPVWTPIEATSGFTFTILYWSQLIPGFVEFLIINASCTFFVGSASVLIGNLKLLRHSLEEIHNRALYLYVKRGGKENTISQNLLANADFRKCMTDCLKENVKHHLQICEFFYKFQDCVGYSLLCVFLGSAITISTPPFTIFMVSGLGDSDKLVTVGVVMIGHIFLSLFLMSRYCQYGQEVITQSDLLLDGYYNTPWYTADLEFRKVLIIAMSNCQSSLQPKSELIKIVADSATFLSTIQTSYSIFNLLVSTK